MIRINKNFVIAWLIGFLLISSVLAEKAILELEQIAETIKYPVEYIVFENYLENERSIHSAKNNNEHENNSPILFPPENIYAAYKISSKIPSSFHPIIITVVKHDSYRTKEFDEMDQDLKKLPYLPLSEGGRLPLGNFKISDQFNGFLIPDTIRILAHRERFDPDFPGVEALVTSYPRNIDASSIFIKLPGDKFDLRISKYDLFEGPAKELVKVEGGEKYYEIHHDKEPDKTIDNPSGNVADSVKVSNTISEAKALSRIVLESPALAPFIKGITESEPIIDVKESKSEKGELIAVEDVKMAPKQIVAQADGFSKWLIVGAIFVIAAIGYFLRKNKKSQS